MKAKSVILWTFLCLSSFRSFSQITNTNANISIVSGTTVKVSGPDLINQNGGTITNNGTLEVQKDIVNDGSFTSGSNSYLIFSGTSQEITGNTDIDIRNLTVQNGTILNIHKDISIKGNLANNGAFNTTATTVFNGPTLQTISGSSTTTFNNLTIGTSGVSLSAPVEVKQLLTLNGNLTTNNQPFTLLSDVQNTAMVINSGGTVIGNATVQRYITPSNAGAGYRHFSSPVSNSTVNDFATTGFTPKVNPTYNALPTPSLSAANFPNVFEYDETRISASYPGFGIGWKSPVSLGAPLEVGKGYDVNIHGASKSDLVGTLNNGTISVSNLTNGALAESGWHLLGNPYPAPIDWEKLSLPAGMNNALYMYKSTAAYTGSYRSYVNGVGNSGDNIIPAMQGFFVRNTSSSPVAFTFTNASRLTSYANPNFYRKAETRPLLKLNLKDSQNRTDAAFIYFEQGATAALDNGFDAYKVLNNDGSPNLFSKVGNTWLSINGQPNLQQTQAIALGTKISQAGNYTLEASQLLNFPVAAEVKLEDRKLNIWQNLKTNPAYTFTAALSDTSRFFVHFNYKVTGINEFAQQPEVVVYPNPATTTINLELNNLSGEVQVGLYNAVGQKVLNKTVGKSKEKITFAFDAANLAKGVYHLKVQSQNGIVFRKIVVQ